MDTNSSKHIQVLEPIGAAVERTSEILFRPFNLGKWMTIGFAAWLAFLGTGHGGPRGGGFGGDGGGGGCNFKWGEHSGDFHHEFLEFKNDVISNLPIVLTLGSCFLLFGLALLVLFVWLRSRGQFVFLNCVARNRTDIADPWSRYASRANSLFLFKLVLVLVHIVIVTAMVVPLGFVIWAFAETDFEVFAAGGVVVGILMVLGIIAVSIVFGIINSLTTDFVVPIMYVQNLAVMQAWKRLWRVITANKGVTILYLLLIFLIGMGLGFATAAIAFTACCCFCFWCVSWLLLIPFVGSYLFTVLTLPLWVWRRAYSAIFLSQFGPEYNVFINPDAPAAPATVVVMPAGPDQPPHSPELDFI